MDGRAGSSQRCRVLFSFGSVSFFLRTPHLSDISGDSVVIFSAFVCNFVCLEDVPLNSIFNLEVIQNPSQNAENGGGGLVNPFLSFLSCGLKI